MLHDSALFAYRIYFVATKNAYFTKAWVRSWPPKSVQQRNKTKQNKKLPSQENRSCFQKVWVVNVCFKNYDGHFQNSKIIVAIFRNTYLGKTQIDKTSLDYKYRM